MVTNISEAERTVKLRELLRSGETDPELYEDLLPDSVFGDLLRVSLANQHEDDQRRDYILAVLAQHDIDPDEVRRLCRS